MSIEERLAGVRQMLEALPEAEEPPPTTLDVLGRSTQEQDWQRLLVYFLTPDAAHGLDHAVLERLLTGLSRRDDLGYSFSRFDLEDVRIAQEVTTKAGVPDVILWSPEEWFICCELKVLASEGQDQTVRYTEVDSFDGIGLDKAALPENGHHYVYLAPEDASSPDADEFVHVPWEWLAGELQSFLAESYGEFPARTTAQLDDFVDTIRSELTMTEYQENQQEKVELYVEHFDEISEVENAFEDQWKEFSRNWGTRLARELESADIVENPNAPAEYESLQLKTDAGKRRQWTFRQGDSDWSWMVPRGWWTKLDEDRITYISDSPNARVGFLHRLDWHREEAIGDRTLILYVRNAPASHDDFYDGFADRFHDARDDLLECIEGTNFEITGNKSNVLRAEYDIEVGAHGDFFEAYIDALSRGIGEGAVSNQQLIDVLDSIYTDTLDGDVQL